MFSRNSQRSDVRTGVTPATIDGFEGSGNAVIFMNDGSV